MLEASIVTDQATLEKSGPLLVGTIYLQVGPHAFPEKGWTDRIALVLSWWLDNIANGRYEFAFMDGSFSFRVNMFDVELLFGDEIQASYPIVGQKLHKSIIKAAGQVIQSLETENYSRSDLAELKDKYSLKRID